jgi:hypothetical protein
MTDRTRWTPERIARHTRQQCGSAGIDSVIADGQALNAYANRTAHHVQQSLLYTTGSAAEHQPLVRIKKP